MSRSSLITGQMRDDDPDSILNAILLTELNGALCPPDGKQCGDCAEIWKAGRKRTDHFWTRKASAG